MSDDLFELALRQPFDTEQSAMEWFVSNRWPDGVRCARCDGSRVHETDYHPSQPYRCSDCKRYFSVKTGTIMQSSKLPLRTWALAICLLMDSKCGINSYDLARLLRVTQPTAWTLTHKIRKAFEADDDSLFRGPVEVDETYVGGKARNQPLERKKRLKKRVVVGMLDRDTNKVRFRLIAGASRPLLSRFIYENAEDWIEVYTDEHKGYQGMRKREHSTVNHSKGERGLTNRIESEWAVFKRGIRGVYLQMSPKHQPRYLVEYQERRNLKFLTMLEKVQTFLARSIGKRLRYLDLIAGGPAYPPIKR